MRASFSKRPIFILAVVLPLVLVMATFAVARAAGYRVIKAAGETEAASSSSLWIGSTYGMLNRSHQLFSAGYSMRGDFWFMASEDGEVSGHAVVAYEPTSSTEGANALISFAKSVESAAVGLASMGIVGGALGALNSTSLALLIGVKVDYEKPMMTRSGAIVGQLDDNRLTLRWRDNQAKDIPVKVVFEFLGNRLDQVLYDGSFKIGAPWPGSANITGDEDGEVWQAVAPPAKERRLRVMWRKRGAATGAPNA